MLKPISGKVMIQSGEHSALCLGTQELYIFITPVDEAFKYIVGRPIDICANILLIDVSRPLTSRNDEVRFEDCCAIYSMKESGLKLCEELKTACKQIYCDDEWTKKDEEKVLKSIQFNFNAHFFWEGEVV